MSLIVRWGGVVLLLWLGWPATSEAWTLRGEAPVEKTTVEVIEIGSGSEAARVVETIETSGFFEIEIESPGFFDVRIEVRGQVPLIFPLRPALGDVMLPEVEPAPAKRWTLFVHDSEGRPVAGARVAFEPRRASNRATWRPASRSSTTAKDGSARLPIQKGERGWLSVWRTDFAPQRLEIDGARPDEIVLNEGEAVSLRALSSHGRPASGVAIRVDEVLVVSTDDEGRATVHVDPKSRWLDLRGREGSWGRVDLQARAAEGDLGTLRLRDPIRVEAKVLDAESLEPVPDALIWAESEPDWTRTRGDGTYQWRGREPPERLVAASPEHWHDARSLRGELGPVFLLPPAPGRLHGRVVDAAARPISEAEITVSFPDLRGRPPAEARLGFRTRTGRDGTFRLTRLPVGEAGALRVEREGYAPATRDLKPGAFAADTPGIEIGLDRGTSVLGRVTTPGADPVVGVALRLRGERAIREIATDAEGKFRFDALPPGPYRLHVRGNGWIPRTLDLHIEGERVEAETIILEKSPRVVGRVVGPAGGAIPGASLRWRAADASTKSGDEGRFVFDTVPVLEEVSLEARAPGYRPTHALLDFVTATSTEVEIVLEKAARLEALVSNLDGEPVEAFWLQLLGPEGEVVDILEPTNGERLLVDHLAPLERAFLRAQSRGRPPATSEPFALVEGETTRVEIVISPGVEVPGEVVDPLGAPVPGALVDVVPDPLDDRVVFSSSASTDGEGRFALEGLEPGPVLVRVTHPSYRRIDEVVEIEVGRFLRFVLDPAGSRSLEGRLVDASGAPVVGARLVVRTDDERAIVETKGAITVVTSTGSRQRAETITDAIGAFSFEGLAAARHVVEVDESIVDRIDLTAGSKEGLLVVLDSP